MVKGLASKIFRMPTGETETIIAWKPKGLPDEGIKSLNTPGNGLFPDWNRFIIKK